MELRFRPEFESDARTAADWYEARVQGLGERFLAELDHSLGQVVEHPMAATEIGPGLRQIKLRRFPYLIVYRLHEAFIEIVAVVHGARHPRRRTGSTDHDQQS